MRTPKSSRFATATHVPATTSVVKAIANDADRQRGEHPDVNWSSLVGRLEYLVSLVREGEQNGREAARRLGIPGETMNGLLRGRTKPSFAILENMHRATGVNLNWLVCNDGHPEDGAPHGRIIWPPTVSEAIAKRTARRQKKAAPVDTRRTASPKRRS